MTLRSWDACAFPLIKMPQALLPFPPRPLISHVPRVCAASFLPAAGYDSTMVLHEDVIEKLSTGFSMFGAVTYKWEKRYTVLTVSTRQSSRRDLRRRCRRRPLYPGSLFTLLQPTNLLYFPTAARPVEGAKPKADLYLGDGYVQLATPSSPHARVPLIATISSRILPAHAVHV